MSTQPTALAQLRHLYQNMLNGGVRDAESAKRIAEGLLGPAIEALERGTPATGGEPVAYVDKFELAHIGLEAFEPTISKAPVSPHDVALYTSPQPVREPLTPGQVNGLLESAGYWSGDPTRADFINDIRYAEATHGITGGQHGTDA